MTEIRGSGRIRGPRKGGMHADMDMKTVFRPALPSEAEAVLRLYWSVHRARFSTWNSDCPPEDIVRADLARGSLFVLVPGEPSPEEERTLFPCEIPDGILGAVSIAPRSLEETYSGWRIRGRTAVISLLAVRCEYHGEGLSRPLVEGALKELKRRGNAAARVIVDREGIPAVRAFLSSGFRTVGYAEMYGHSFMLCEKDLR